MNKPVNRKFRKLDIHQRLNELRDSGHINADDCLAWQNGEHLLNSDTAKRMIENVIGTFSLPQGIAINFPLNDRLYCVPLVVEEPSVVAALSYAALTAEKAGGFRAEAQSALLHGQIQLVQLSDIDAAHDAILARSAEILEAANALMPAMLARGGGAKKVSARKLYGRDNTPMLVVHISIDTRDAMGANLVNTVCEGMAPMLENISGGSALLKILSNLADEAVAHAEVTIPAAQLANKQLSGEAMCERIAMANELAVIDPWRATTHNKGIMNGISPLAVATGNDWRSIEAAAHAYAAIQGQYRALTEWRVVDSALHGKISLPIKVGTVGGSLQTNPAVAMNQRLLGVSSSSELAALMAAVGLAQNFAALRALVSSGIQQGHMAMHARSVALSAGTPDHVFDEVVRRMIDEGEIKVWRAREISQELLNNSSHNSSSHNNSSLNND